MEKELTREELLQLLTKKEVQNDILNKAIGRLIDRYDVLLGKYVDSCNYATKEEARKALSIMGE